MASQVTLTALRVVTGFLFFQHGYPKLFGSLPGSGEVEDAVQFLSVIWVSGLLEVVGGALIMAGLFIRPVAFVLAGEMAVAYFWRHAPRGFWPGSNRGELAALYCFVFLYLCAAGGGRWSLDTWLRRRRDQPVPS
ncbi:MAG: DoxX family protein [Gemmatimonadales bacterium]